MLFLLAAAVRRLRVAAAFLPAATRFVDFRVVDFLAVDFLRAGLRAVDFFAVDFLRAGLRAVVFFRAVVLFLVAAAFLPAADRFAAVRFRVVAAFFAAADRFADGLLRAAVFRAAIPSPFPPGYEGSWATTPSV